jgi:Ner family transcriptional regulator
MKDAKAKASMGATPQDWHPEDIKAAVRKTGISLDALGRQNGYAQGSIRTVLTAWLPRAQAIIADRIGVPPQTIWPSRYDPQTGEPLTGFFSTGVIRSRHGATAQRQNGKAA